MSEERTCPSPDAEQGVMPTQQEQEICMENGSRSQYLVKVHVKPIFGTEDEMKAFFGTDGIVYHSIRFYDKFGFVIFTSTADAQVFIDKFNGAEVNGTRLQIEMGRRKFENVSPCRRLYVAGYTVQKSRPDVTERDVWNLAAPLGFVRRIVYHPTYSFIDYDTVEEATSARGEIEKVTLNGRKLTVSFAKTTPCTDLASMSMQLTDILPYNHSFWSYISESVRPRKD